MPISSWSDKEPRATYGAQSQKTSVAVCLVSRWTVGNTSDLLIQGRCLSLTGRVLVCWREQLCSSELHTG